MPNIPLNLPGAGYDIRIEAGLLSRLGADLRHLFTARKIVVITDSHVGPLHLHMLRRACTEAGFEMIEMTIPAGEEHKRLSTVEQVYDRVLGAGIDRATPILALGGGVVGDLAGFVAATMLRGVPFVQVPTTLLAMVDASIGGKTGVNHAVGKNLIGAFHQPRAVVIDPQVLSTLPPNELRNGLAECIKHELIRDADGFTRLEQNIGRALALDMEYLTDLIAHNVAIKARIVEADPLEQGKRAHLNLGHTFGHAIETVSQYQYSHGQCVALGMIAACRAARAMNMLDDVSVTRIEDLIAAAGLPTGQMNLASDEVSRAMSFDKKVEQGRLRLVLPDRIGHVVIRDDVPAEVVRDAIASLRE